MNESQKKPRTFQEQTHEEIIRAAAHMIADKALGLIEVDMHTFSTRPCQTCTSITSLIGRPFGCVNKAMSESRIKAQH
jgi:hypothetical protein